MVWGLKGLVFRALGLSRFRVWGFRLVGFRALELSSFRASGFRVRGLINSKAEVCLRRYKVQGSGLKVRGRSVLPMASTRLKALKCPKTSKPQTLNP